LSTADEPQGKEYLIPAELIVKASTGFAPSGSSCEEDFAQVATNLPLTA